MPLTPATGRGSGSAQALGLAVSGGSVYFCGTFDNRAAYWDPAGNGWKLAAGAEAQSSANGIFVVKH